jgi:hypothetical protein
MGLLVMVPKLPNPSGLFPVHRRKERKKKINKIKKNSVNVVFSITHFCGHF